MCVCPQHPRLEAGRGVSGSTRLGEAEEGMCGKSQLSAAGPKLFSCADRELPGARAGGGFRFEALRQKARIRLPKGAEAAWLGDAEPQSLLALSPVLTILRFSASGMAVRALLRCGGGNGPGPQGERTPSPSPLLPNPLQSCVSLG